MFVYLIKRILMTIPVLLAVSTIVFFLIHAIPGDPIDLIVGENAMPADRSQIAAELGLNKPVLVQYKDFLEGLVRGDWGKSIYDRRPVLSHISERYGATLMLAVSAMFLAILIAIPIGVFSAIEKGKFIDNFAMFLALIGISIPNFWLGPVLVLIFSVHYGLLPISGMDSYGSLILPTITLGLSLSAMLSRLTRSSMIEEIKKEYMTTARAKGLTERTVIFKHAMRNAMNPVITIIGLQVGTLLAGAIITEKIFNWPGIGSLLLDSISRRDYPLVEGCVLIIAFTYVIVNAFTDCVYRIADPRVKL